MYTDLLTRIKNAQSARLETVKAPYSNMDMAVSELLAARGYIENVQKKGRLPKRVIEIKLKYTDAGGAITGIRFLSKPSRRRYFGWRDLRPVKQGYGLLIMSTPKGIMASTEAKKQKLGGEALFEIW